MDNLVEKYHLVYDGSMEEDNNKIYIFANFELAIEDSKQLFYELYEEDIEEYASEHSVSDEDFKVVGCSIYLYVDKETGEVDEDYITLQPLVEYDDGESAELLGAFVELDDENINKLLELVKK